jgi:hypothetical protein
LLLGSYVLAASATLMLEAFSAQSPIATARQSTSAARTARP